jgi:Zn-dependent M28 family amino/carboxypeptidase
MIKKLIPLVALSLFISCTTAKKTVDYDKIEAEYVNQISTENLKKHLTIIASDEMEGRNTGSEGQKKSGRYMINEYKKMNVTFPTGAKDYYQPVPASYLNARRNLNLPDSENIWAFIEGSDKKDEIVVVSAHYDHVGMKDGEIYNGADDDGSGTVALMEIARVFKKAKEEGKGPRRSILILHVTAEEVGLIGSRYYSENPLFPLANTVADVNIDMIGRRDDLHKDSSSYVYVIGSDYLSSELHEICLNANKRNNLLDLDFKYNDKSDPNRFYYRSDHYNFAKNGIPSVFLFSGVHEDYHKPTDDVDKIEFDAVTKRTKYAFAIAWEIANRENRLVVDKSDDK